MGPKDPQPPGPAWLRNLIGVDYFDKVVAVSFEQGPLAASRVELSKLRQALPSLKKVYVDW